MQSSMISKSFFLPKIVRMIECSRPQAVSYRIGPQGLLRCINAGDVARIRDVYQSPLAYSITCWWSKR